MKHPRLHTIAGFFQSSNPLDATTYYIGAYAQALSTSATGIRQMNIPISGKIVMFQMETWSVTTAGSNEDWPVIIRKNNTTDYPVQTLASNSQHRTWKNTNLDIPVNADDFLTIKTVTPTWATNPEAFQGWFIIVIQIP